MTLTLLKNDGQPAVIATESASMLYAKTGDKPEVVAIERFCPYCGARLSIYNKKNICAPCRFKHNFPADPKTAVKIASKF